MKKTFVIITMLLVLVSCSTTKEAQTETTKASSRSEKKLATQAKVRKAVESKRFVVKLDKAYLNYGEIAQLIPKANYIVIDGDKAILSMAYGGRQYDIRPIAGISMRGVTTDYVVTSNLKKGIYEIKMKVVNNTNTFDLFLTIGKNGECSASVTNLYIDFIRYRGNIYPIKEKTVPLQDNAVIG